MVVAVDWCFDNNMSKHSSPIDSSFAEYGVFFVRDVASKATEQK